MAVYQGVCFSVFVAALVFGICDARIHQLVLKNETRSVIHLNTFGFYADGTLDVNLTALRLPKGIDYAKYSVGFSLSRSRVNGVFTYTQTEDTEECELTKQNSAEPLILFLMDLRNGCVNVTSFGVQDTILTGPLKAKKEDDKPPAEQPKRDKRADKDNKDRAANTSNTNSDKSANIANTTPDQTAVTGEDWTTLEDRTTGEGGATGEGGVTGDNAGAEVTNMEEKETKGDGNSLSAGNINGMRFELQKIGGSYNFSFHMKFGPRAEGLYNLNFHRCSRGAPGFGYPYYLNVEIIEKNPGGFLSAAEIPLPLLYIGMAAVFFIAAMVWVYTLMKHRYSVFKIHWLMAALAFTKSISLVFHSINYHFINTKGHPIEGWAVMYYITHLLKGALLFITLALIGTGWAFVKYILSDKEKKIFMIVIPLQVLANVAYIIIESTEEGSSDYALWKEVLFLVDLICCGAILFPVVWSIRHLQDASSTDGKAAMNLEKLKLFRHYYVMIVCYIYFTRIIAILLKVTIPFQWQWFYEFLVEVSTLIFFVMTGYKFRPASNNPYLQLPQDEEDVEMDEVVTESGALEGISRVKKTLNGRERQRDSTL
ncbi:hypothetical protein AGOR_G00196620 [Albula goreensis]|uniref:GOST seven transmembrane domain-containing protein n=1 Tax=Albula goreensis TaxID=1534307 RepID=A0A8T3CSG9_9TELE|nr:hypothetical protein AGOR_G00196620 [Albula goreensis]